VGLSTSSNFRSNTHLAKFLALVHTLVEVLVGPILSYKTQRVLVLVCSDRAVRECTAFFEDLEDSIWVRAVMAGAWADLVGVAPANPVLVDHLVVSLEPHSSSSMEEVEDRLLQAARDSPLATLAEDSPLATLAEVPSMAEAPCY
jgi:hypothetical protein